MNLSHILKKGFEVPLFNKTDVCLIDVKYLGNSISTWNILMYPGNNLLEENTGFVYFKDEEAEKEDLVDEYEKRSKQNIEDCLFLVRGYHKS